MALGGSRVYPRARVWTLKRGMDQPRMVGEGELAVSWLAGGLLLVVQPPGSCRALQLRHGAWFSQITGQLESLTWVEWL